jgi:hypothetical protein
MNPTEIEDETVVDEPRELAVITEQVGRQQIMAPTKGMGASLQPNGLTELMSLCATLAKAGDAVPKSYQGKPGAIMVGITAGAELGLPWSQSLQGIVVINGVASVFGKLAKALVMRHRDFLDAEEWFDGKPDDDVFEAHCIIRRAGRRDVHASFSKADAIRTKLWNKPGPWGDGYQKRMCMWRARSIAYADQFPDALQGFGIVEEMIDVTPRAAITGNANGLTRAGAVLETMRAAEAPQTIDPTDVIVQGERGPVVPPEAEKPKVDVLAYCVKCGGEETAHDGKAGICACGSCDGQKCTFEPEPADAPFAEAEKEQAQAIAADRSDEITPRNLREVAHNIRGGLDLGTANAVAEQARASGVGQKELGDIIFEFTGQYVLKKGPSTGAVMGALRAKSTRPT